MDNKCNICGAEVDFFNGGAAVMMAFCIRRTTNLINLSYCKDCYGKFVDEPLRALNRDARMNLSFGDEDRI